jgi:hypothetical protein
MELFVKLLHLCVRFLVPSFLVCQLDLVVAAQDGGNLLFVEGVCNERVLVEVGGIILHVWLVASASKELGLAFSAASALVAQDFLVLSGRALFSPTRLANFACSCYRQHVQVENHVSEMVGTELSEFQLMFVVQSGEAQQGAHLAGPRWKRSASFGSPQLREDQADVELVN